jgi:hypothetical protein
MKWSDVDLSTLTFTEKRGGGVKISPLLRFQIPTGRVMYDGISSFSSVTLEMPDHFIEWWTELEKVLGRDPFRSNVSHNGLRIKVDPATQFFDESRKSIFPELVEGSLKGDTLSCIIEIPSVYYFQDMYGLVVRMYQGVVRSRAAADGCLFLNDEEKFDP